MSRVAVGTPTKEFFMEMLTRDIQLNDAILDLLDNCLDGVLRQKGAQAKKSDPMYYSGYSAEIEITADSFSMQDNCGGIPIQLAEQYAFRMGRGSEGTNDGLPTVGIYGIGMKRAIFKIGKSAIVETNNKDDHYRVIIEDTWVQSDKWDFPIEELQSDIIQGTKITVDKLNEEISGIWDTSEKIEAFVSELVKAIRESYSLIIEKGFSIRVNDKVVGALPTELLIDKDGIKPYIYKANMGSVSVNLVIGFYAPISSDEDIDEINESKRSSPEAGWTVVCNDRVVLYNDKSYLSGWGVAGVPSYHTQFIGIRGIVFFESDNPKELPMTTTKRGIDLSSEVYAATKNKMMEGLKLFTGYTNSWKRRLGEERQYSSNANKVPVAALLKNDDFQTAFNYNAPSQGVYKPLLPKPIDESTRQRISFTKNKDDIDVVGNYLFGRDDSVNRPVALIGEKCFDKVLAEASNKGSVGDE
jgi:hypothetical protein